MQYQTVLGNQPNLTETYQVVRASAALPAAGAYDTPATLQCAGCKEITLFVSYTRGAAGGKVKLKVEFSPTQVGPWFQEVVTGETIAAGGDITTITQRRNFEYASSGATIERFALPIPLGTTKDRVRVSAAESGVVGTPGTCEILAVIT